MRNMRTIMVTGGAGFIGSNFAHFLIAKTSAKVIVLDKLTYAGHRETLLALEQNPRFSFIQADITDEKKVRSLFQEHQPNALVNFAAETHVDRSIDGPRAFVETNIMGVFVLLEASRHYLKSKNNDSFRFLQVSTDEVYGSLGPSGLFSEETPYSPNSPYAASKASADHLVHSYFETYKLPVLITNCSNNYGPYQFPEKLIPLMILNALEGKPLPIYGDGKNVRDWLYVEDHCEGIFLVLEKGRLGEKYNIGGNNEKTNIEIVDAICENLDQLKPQAHSYKTLKKIRCRPSRT